MGSSGSDSPESPDPDTFSNYGGSDMAAHLKRKELFSQRKQREFIPDNKKDDSYWDRRRRNNEAAKRSREKRRFNDMVLEQRVVELTKENHVLKAQLDAIKDKYNISGENLVSVDQIMATLPTNEQVLSITKRAKLSTTIPQTIIYPNSPSPVPISVIHQPISGMESPNSRPESPQLHHYQPNNNNNSNNYHHHHTQNNKINHLNQQLSQQTQLSQQNPQTLLNEASNSAAAVAVVAAAVAFNNSHHQHHHHNQYHHPQLQPQHTHNQQQQPSATSTPSTIHILNHHLQHSSTQHQSAAQHFYQGRHNPQQLPNLRHTSSPSQIIIDDDEDDEIDEIETGAQQHYNNNFKTESTPFTSTTSPSATNKCNERNIIQSSGSISLAPAIVNECVSDTGNSRSTNTPSASPSYNVLNLSSRRGQSPYGISSGTGSGTQSGDDEDITQQMINEQQTNSLPLKLRHKSHLGDKDAATALLALHNIKQEPNCVMRTTTPPWDNEGSSDERDSGISLGGGVGNTSGNNSDWTTAAVAVAAAVAAKTTPTTQILQRKLTIPTVVQSQLLQHHHQQQHPILQHHHTQFQQNNDTSNNTTIQHNKREYLVRKPNQQPCITIPVVPNVNVTLEDKEEENIHLKSQLARLESEVATIKNMMILNTGVSGSTAAAQ